MRKIAIIGAGGFGREVKLIIDRINTIKPTYTLIGFYDDNKKIQKNIHGIPLLGSIDDLLHVDKEINLVFGIGIPEVKVTIYNRINLKTNFLYPNIIDPSAIVGTDAVRLGKGCVLCAHAVITCDIILKDFITVNLACTIGHDTTINSFSSFMPGVHISGDVIIDREVYIGTGAKVINQLKIGQQTIIGAGAVVAKSLPPHCTAVGIPAKPIKFHNE